MERAKNLEEVNMYIANVLRYSSDNIMLYVTVLKQLNVSTNSEQISCDLLEMTLSTLWLVLYFKAMIDILLLFLNLYILVDVGRQNIYVYNQNFQNGFNTEITFCS